MLIKHIECDGICRIIWRVIITTINETHSTKG